MCKKPSPGLSESFSIFLIERRLRPAARARRAPGQQQRAGGIFSPPLFTHSGGLMPAAGPADRLTPENCSQNAAEALKAGSTRPSAPLLASALSLASPAAGRGLFSGRLRGFSALNFGRHRFRNALGGLRGCGQPEPQDF